MYVLFKGKVFYLSRYKGPKYNGAIKFSRVKLDWSARAVLYYSSEYLEMRKKYLEGKMREIEFKYVCIILEKEHLLFPA